MEKQGKKEREVVQRHAERKGNGQHWNLLRTE